MRYQVLVLDLDGTLTNSKKEITVPTKRALIEIQQAGKIVVLASGRPINGVAPLAEELELEKYGGYMLSFNGARITQCSSSRLIYNRTVPQEVIRPIFEYVRDLKGVNIISYSDTEIFSAKSPCKYTMLESRINNMNVVVPDDFPASLPSSVNKLLLPGEPEALEALMPKLKAQYHGLLSIYRSEPFFPGDHAAEYRQGHLSAKTAEQPGDDCRRDDLLRRRIQRRIHDRIRRTRCGNGKRPARRKRLRRFRNPHK